MDDSGLHERLAGLRVGSRSTPPRQPSAVVLVDTPAECERVCTLLAAQPRLALDLEGVDLCRSGRVCVLQVGCEDGIVYLFDICTLCAPNFPEALHTDVLANEAVQKLMFDCRSDADALHHLHGVSIKNVRGCRCRRLSLIRLFRVLLSRVAVAVAAAFAVQATFR
jgi:hypothetical protein